MKARIKSILLLLIVISTSTFLEASSVPDIRSRQKQVRLRAVGHQLLLSIGDSSSHVMPIEVDGARYKISFDTELGFLPDTLESVVNRVIKKAKIATKYMVEVQECNDGQVVYGYVVDPTDDHLLPCGGRSITKGCYDVYFTDFEDDIFLATVPPSLTDLNRKSIAKTVALLCTMLGFVLFFFVWNKTREKKIKPVGQGTKIGKYLHDSNGLKLTINDQTIELTSKESTLLALLHQNKNETVKREDLLSHVWGDEGDYVGRTLDVFVSKLRKKIALDPSLKIVNTRGVGYRLTESHA